MSEGPRRVELDPRAYDDRWARLAAAGHGVHGEADCVERLLPGIVEPGRPPRVLDAGCGTGRVAIRLAEHGCRTVGVDVDTTLLARAAAKAPECEWVAGDLAALAPDQVPGPFDAIVAAGNVMIFLAAGTESLVVEHLAARLAPGGVLVCGFQLTGPLTIEDYDAMVAAAGLARDARHATWDGAPFAGGDYVVAVDRLLR
ncbi:MAG: class I SAM-dependent DNA methyltransferase [Acidimicrobiia bacterium]